MGRFRRRGKSRGGGEYISASQASRCGEGYKTPEYEKGAGVGGGGGEPVWSSGNALGW